VFTVANVPYCDTLKEARSNLQESVQLVLEANRAPIKENLRDKSVTREPFLNFMKADRPDPFF
jgi:hypothetical protein